MKKFEEIENQPSKKWLFIVPDDLHYSEYLDIFKNLVKRAKLRMIYFAVDFTKNHSHCYFEFSVPRTLEYMKSFSFGTKFEKANGSPSFIYSYLEDGIKSVATIFPKDTCDVEVQDFIRKICANYI